jgi:hypothetical protein
MRRSDVTVIYSSLGEKADSVIKNMLSSSIKPWIVVSSDREIYEFARKRYLVVLKADEFTAKLASASATGDTEGPGNGFAYEDEDEDGDPQRAGERQSE